MWQRIGTTVALSTVMMVGAACRCRHPALGCRFEATTRVVVIQLSHEDPEARKAAATALRTNRGVPSSAIEPLVRGVMSETRKDVHGEMLITLGYSGHPRALEHIRMTLAIPDSAAHHHGRKALAAWTRARSRVLIR